MSYPSDLTDERWDLLEPVFNAPGRRGRKHADHLQTVVDAMLYIAQTGCQWTGRGNALDGGHRHSPGS
jgi:putative transposase